MRVRWCLCGWLVFIFKNFFFERGLFIFYTMMDYGQDTLFGKKVISTIGYDEQEMIRDILYLHARGKHIDCDPTYSIGNFYKNGVPKPKYKFDKFPQLPDVIEATADNLPMENESCEVIMFDPPFILGDAEREQDIIGDRFTRFKEFSDLQAMYSASLKEFARVLKQGGIIIFKCQDTISGGKNHFTHCWTMYEAIQQGFYPKDMFILFAKNRLNDGREQQHGRKYHCYYWVFEKRACRVDYLNAATSDIQGEGKKEIFKNENVA